MVGLLASGFDAAGAGQWAAAQQRDFQNAMARSLRAIQSGDGRALGALCSLSAAYGFVHAVGPGHGKVLLGGAALAGRASFWRMIWLTAAASLAQASTAILLMLGGISLFRLTAAQAVEVTERFLAPASLVAIAAIGLVLIWRGLARLAGRELRPHSDHGHGGTCDCGHQHGPNTAELEAVSGWKDALALVGSIAMRPCTGALFLLAIAWRFDILAQGMLAVFAMGLGTALFNGLVACSGVAARRFVLLGGVTNGATARIIHGVLSLAGGLLIAAMSLGMLRSFV